MRSGEAHRRRTGGVSIGTKICGLTDAAAVAAVVTGGARYAGFVFYEKSPRAVTPEQAATLIAALPDSVTPVGLFVDATDDEIRHTLAIAPLRVLQLHGAEPPRRVASVRGLTGWPVIKALGVATAADLKIIRTYEPVADMMLLDAKPPKGAAAPGGNAVTFDWGLLRDMRLTRPWLLAGGLTVDNLAEAVAVAHPSLVDVSSGVEDAPGMKNPAKIAAFLDLAARLETSY